MHKFPFWLMVTLSCVAVTPSAVHAQDDAHAQHQAMPCEACPPARVASGTSWQPDAAGIVHPYRPLGDWWIGTHVQAALVATDESGPRGDSAVFAPNHGMVNLRRSLQSGATLGIKSMWSLEPLMGPEGYPLVLQSGETADGVNPLADRQHPHDFVMELAFTYERPLSSGARVSFYVAAVGEPALGPPAYMHRRSGELLPIAPITHHWFDSTHTTQGVVTAGFAPTSTTRFEVSAFNGREPDEHRWNLAAPRIDSFSARLSINPNESLAIQASAGFLNDAERVHPGANITRMTASAIYSRRWARVSVDALVAAARNARSTTQVEVPGGYYYTPGDTAPAFIAEATIGLWGRHQVIVRTEAAEKGELFNASDPRHLQQFGVSRSTIGYALPILARSGATVHLGAAWSAMRVADELKADYGGHQTGLLGFVRVSVH